LSKGQELIINFKEIEIEGQYVTAEKKAVLFKPPASDIIAVQAIGLFTYQ